MGIFDNIIGNTKGALGLSGGGMPGSSAVELDQGTKNLMAQRQAAANKSDADIAAETTKGTERGGEQLQSDADMSLSDDSLGMQDDPSLRAALKKRQSHGFERSMNSIKQKALQEAPIERFNRLQGLTGAQAEQSQMQFENFKRDKQAEANKKAARNQVISGLLGVGGTIAGAAVGGGAGAAAGGQIGGSLAGPTQMQGVG